MSPISNRSLLQHLVSKHEHNSLTNYYFFIFSVAENEALSSELEAFEKDIKAVEQETADLESSQVEMANFLFSCEFTHASQPPISKLNDLLERSVVERDLLAGDLQAAENDLKISEAKVCKDHVLR